MAHGAGALIKKEAHPCPGWQQFENYAGHLKMAAKNSDSDFILVNIFLFTAYIAAINVLQLYIFMTHRSAH